VPEADGTLPWVEGDRKACRRAEAMNFVPSADRRSATRKTSPGCSSGGAAPPLPVHDPSPASTSARSTSRRIAG